MHPSILMVSKAFQTHFFTKNARRCIYAMLHCDIADAQYLKITQKVSHIFLCSKLEVFRCKVNIYLGVILTSKKEASWKTSRT